VNTIFARTSLLLLLVTSVTLYACVAAASDSDRRLEPDELERNYQTGQAIWRSASLEVERASAMELFRENARVGHAPSINALAVGYRLASGVPRDTARAFALFSFAADLGFEPARANVEILNPKLTVEERTAGEKRLESLREEWKVHRRLSSP